MILSFKTKFPDGTPTEFEDKIEAAFYPEVHPQPKLHSLREDSKDRWREGRKIHMATGVRTKNYQCFWTGMCKGIQEIQLEYRVSQVADKLILGKLTAKVDNRSLTRKEIEELIKNDGLNYSQFIKWFFPNGSDTWNGKIIHWTDKRY